MFKEIYPKEGGDVETVIGPSVKVEGDFTSKGNVTVEGVVHGTIKTEKDLKVGVGAKISASVFATNAFIAGEIKGNVKIGGKLELTDTSKIYGDIEAKIITMAAGAIMNGKCTMCHDVLPLPRVEDSEVLKKNNKK
jgi:cytoskeletal protein CcmA (bactofilin family)